MAYFWVQLRAVCSYLERSVLYMCAISGTKGSSGFGSVKSEHIDSSTCNFTPLWLWTHKIMIFANVTTSDQIHQCLRIQMAFPREIPNIQGLVRSIIQTLEQLISSWDITSYKLLRKLIRCWDYTRDLK